MTNKPILSENARRLLEARYLLKNDNGDIIETPADMLNRVAYCVAEAEKLFGSKSCVKKWADVFLSKMLNMEIVPASPFFFNCRLPGHGKTGNLHSCFVLPIEDSIEGIYNTLKEAAIIYKASGGIGICLSNLREEDSIVGDGSWRSSGALSFLEVMDKSAAIVANAGSRRSASMAMFDITHPDIEKFIKIKSIGLQEIKRLKSIIDNTADMALKAFVQREIDGLQKITKFNLSVKITDAFMKAVNNNEDWNLISVKTDKIVKVIKAKKLFNMICESAWLSAEPGVCFIDTVHRGDLASNVGLIESANPCAEQPLHNYNCCNLIAINLNKLVVDGIFDFDMLKENAKICTRFCEDAFDVSAYPLKKIEDMVKKIRGIGIGVMGFADILIDMGIKYDSKEACDLIAKIYKTIESGAIEESNVLAQERGVPYYYEGSWWHKNNIKVRNLFLTNAQPTGSVAIIADASHSIEPYYSVYYNRQTADGKTLVEINKKFQAAIEKVGLNINDIIEQIRIHKTIQTIKEIPQSIKDIFRCAGDISPEWHVKIQAAAQQNIHQSVSKTVNLPQCATVQDVKNIYMLAHKLGCKGITVFRDGCRTGVLSFDGGEYKDKFRKFLVQKYSRENLTAKEIGDLLGVSEQCVFAKLKRYGIRKAETQTAICASNRPLGGALKDVILANVLVGHSKINTVGQQSSFRLVSDHLVYAQNIRAQFLDRGIDCGDIMSIVTDKTYYYFDTHFLVDIYNLPIDYDSIVSIKSKRELKQLLTNHFVRHLFLVGGIQTKKGGVKFTPNSRNGVILKQFMELLADKLEIEIKFYDDGNIYIPKANTNIFYDYVEDNVDISMDSNLDLLCPECGMKLEMTEGCKHCSNCNWGACST